MNSLPFGSFHAKHFGPDQVARWQGFLFHRLESDTSQQNSDLPNVDHYNNDYGYYDQAYYYPDHNNNEYHQSHNEQPDPTTKAMNENDQQDDNQYDEYDHYDENDQYDEYDQYTKDTSALSKETIAIFQFSEAYKKERDAINKAEEAIENEEDEWAFDESTVAHRNGIEAPVTTLVLSEPSSSVTEHLLNSAYLESCSKGTQQSPIVLWPILPLRL
ncbi:hypothetical protein CLU79DRAFT_838877 [Phycomyces nitens]|nr:hypothetical protein CLU79DRAFT_838877 [Phycomyces nitens]